MNPDRTLQGTFWAMIIAQTIGGVDMPGKGPRKLPAPRLYVAASALWGLMHLAADIAPRFGKAIAAMSVAVVLTAMVVGPFGQRFIDALNGLSGAIAPTSPSGPTSTPAPAGRTVSV